MVDNEEEGGALLGNIKARVSMTRVWVFGKPDPRMGLVDPTEEQKLCIVQAVGGQN